MVSLEIGTGITSLLNRWEPVSVRIISPAALAHFAYNDSVTISGQVVGSAIDVLVEYQDEADVWQTLGIDAAIGGGTFSVSGNILRAKKMRATARNGVGTPLATSLESEMFVNVWMHGVFQPVRDNEGEPIFLS